MDGGQTPVELFSEIQDNFYASCQKAWKQWKTLGIDPGELFAAALNDMKALRNLIKKAANDRNAQLLSRTRTLMRLTSSLKLTRGELSPRNICDL